jgi:hypothetical protein
MVHACLPHPAPRHGSFRAGVTAGSIYYSPPVSFLVPPTYNFFFHPPASPANMDIVLELWDTFIGDRLYSTLVPASLSSSISLPAFANAANSSLALFGASEPFVYEPATQLLHLEPSKYAYLSAWPRNNAYRQFTSFFLITWYAVARVSSTMLFLGY